MRRAAAVLVLAAVAAVAGPAAGAAASNPARGSFRKVHVPPAMATYEWRNAGDLTSAEAGRKLRWLRANGFTTVYLEIGRYLDAYEEAPGAEGRRERLDTIRRQIQRFVAAATGLGIATHGLGGGPTWTGELAYLGQKLVSLVGHYNAKVSSRERLQGVHLDLEPYTLDGWLDDDTVEANLVEYLTTLEGIVDTYRSVLDRHHSRHLQLGFAVPFWFDARGDAPGPVGYDGATKPAVHHVVDLVADLPGAYLVVMSYRNYTRTSDGSIAHARDEFRYAARVGASSGLVVGQQYGPPGPGEERTSFHGLPRWVFKRAAAEITLAFRRYPQFRGLAVDDVDSYMAAGP
jgi:hypothetical protein